MNVCSDCQRIVPPDPPKQFVKGKCKSCYNRALLQEHLAKNREPIPAPEGLEYGRNYRVSHEAPQDRGRVGTLVEYHDMIFAHRAEWGMLRDAIACFCVHRRYLEEVTE